LALYGGGNGICQIARGTVPLALWLALAVRALVNLAMIGVIWRARP